MALRVGSVGLSYEATESTGTGGSLSGSLLDLEEAAVNWLGYARESSLAGN